MNNHTHWLTEIWIWIIMTVVVFLCMGFTVKGDIRDKFLVEQQTLCAVGTGIIYQRYAWNFIERKDMRFMTDDEYKEYCIHAGSIEREPKDGQ